MSEQEVVVEVVLPPRIAGLIARHQETMENGTPAQRRLAEKNAAFARRYGRSVEDVWGSTRARVSSIRPTC